MARRARLLARHAHVRDAAVVHTATQEIEVKYRVPDRSALLAALVARGVQFGPPVEQDDQAYAPEGWQYGDSKIGVPFVRLRTQAGRHLFTLKRPVGNELSCVEHETEVADRQTMHHAIQAMGFNPTVRIHKFRRTASHKDLSLCLDEVTGIGSFFEVETLVGTDFVGQDRQADMHQFVGQLDVELDRVTATYDSLVRETLV
jgi:adenylate cyclase, class 2